MKKRNYTLNATKISTLLPKVLKKLSGQSKNGSKILELKMNWDNIINDDISNNIFVDSIRKINNKNTLIIISNKANLVEISYSAELIKKKNKYIF